VALRGPAQRFLAWPGPHPRAFIALHTPLWPVSGVAGEIEARHETKTLTLLYTRRVSVTRWRLSTEGFFAGTVAAITTREPRWATGATRGAAGNGTEALLHPFPMDPWDERVSACRGPAEGVGGPAGGEDGGRTSSGTRGAPVPEIHVKLSTFFAN